MRTNIFKEKERLKDIKIRNREHNYRKFEVVLIFIATLFSSGALYFSWQSSEASRDQASSARESIYFGARTESFINYSRKFREFCNGFDYGSSVPFDITNGNPVINYPEEFNIVTLTEDDVRSKWNAQSGKVEGLGQAMDELRLWLPINEAYEVYQSYIKTTDMNVIDAFLDTKYPNSVAFDASRVACYSTHQELMNWYIGKTDETELRILIRDDVALNLGGGKQEVDILTAWGLQDTLTVNEKYRKLLLLPIRKTDRTGEELLKSQP